MAISLAEYEAFDLEFLTGLKTEPDFQETFGISRVQRHGRIGYNRAARLVEVGVEKGLLARCDNPTYHFRFV
ncbi:ftsk gamma domain protein [Alteromonas macleodii]|uniref:Ftsk gamma domain protein n=1 Tax=Alteromonas macleodii TaxID=28108 RepID=A0AB36FMS8_ALTMA|nr:ftsk gamma domain protein [Alteromonas macleodii]OES25536.1 ftsk gamma domain protein [Alteromonas macleodii]OES25837.1 ftsk gamma domain protein [Alteromonas macleodii]OES38641.1 ftsk gamma domain protein [Alteromonas macleodii]